MGSLENWLDCVIDAVRDDAIEEVIVDGSDVIFDEVPVVGDV